MSLFDILDACSRLAGGAGAGALASVARRRGSLPMSGSAKMLVLADGSRIGTVGGGCLEAEITERAYDVLERRAPATSEHTLNSEAAGDYGLTCGGTAVMFIEPVFPDPILRDVYVAAASLVARGDRGVMATAAIWEQGPRKALLASGGLVGTADTDIHAAVSAFDSRSEEQLLTEQLLVERVAGAPRLIVFGGGHVGASVGQAAAFAGWRVTVVDDRAEFSDVSRMPWAERAMICDYHDIPAALGIDSDCYVVVATRGHQHDALVVDQLARSNLRYLGMLGSRRKVALTWRLLSEQGHKMEQLEEIHAPVGLSIGADTPQEIAISIVAELIAVRRSGSRRRGGISQDFHESGSLTKGVV